MKFNAKKRNNWELLLKANFILNSTKTITLFALNTHGVKVYYAEGRLHVTVNSLKSSADNVIVNEGAVACFERHAVNR